jgi:predicted ribonuclease YlaK
MKIKLDERGKQNAEKALRLLNNESSREIIYEFADTSLLPDDFDKRSPDNMILSVALKYKDENPIMLTSDNGLQLKSKILKISTISLKNFLKR